MTIRKGYEEIESEAKSVIDEYRKARINLSEADRIIARDRAIYRLKQLGRTAGYALRELEGTKRERT